MITINDKQIEWKSDETVLETAERAGIDIPHLCAFEGSPTPQAACRVCMVEVEKMPRLQTSCTLMAQDGMVVRTHRPRIQQARRNIVELLLASHPDDCLSAPQRKLRAGELASDLGIRERKYSASKRRTRSTFPRRRS